MGNAGRLRIAIHGYNTHANVEVLLQELKAVLMQVG
jgi:selenocysteine lyase/cysteine desulfurase